MGQRTYSRRYHIRPRSAAESNFYIRWSNLSSGGNSERSRSTRLSRLPACAHLQMIATTSVNRAKLYRYINPAVEGTKPGVRRLRVNCRVGEAGILFVYFPMAKVLPGVIDPNASTLGSSPSLSEPWLIWSAATLIKEYLRALEKAMETRAMVSRPAGWRSSGRPGEGLTWGL